jgi:hypothetical protein
MKIIIEVRNTYGTVRNYPVCTNAKLFAALCRSKTLADSDLLTIMALGFDVEIQEPVKQ